MNLFLMKSFTKLLISLIMFVILFLMSTFLYSARYWPDIYNYINANITIKRIPRISELKVTAFSLDDEYTTEMYSTIDSYDYTDMSTIEDVFEIEMNDFTVLFNEEFDSPKARIKRKVKIEDVNKDYSLLPEKSIVVDYFFDNEETTRLFKDLVDEKKLTTRNLKDVELVTEVSVNSRSARLEVMSQRGCHGNGTINDIHHVVLPWIAAIFVKNDTTDQFDYYCDGALLSNTTVITAARCVHFINETQKAVNLIVVVGKRSLRTVGDGERAYKVKEILLHENFTDEMGRIENDLAVLRLKEIVEVNVGIKQACIGEFEEEFKLSATTGWRYTGELTPIYFNKQKIEMCENNNVENTFCATYGDDVAVCPSFGGLYVTQSPNNLWYLQGIRAGDPTVRGICTDKTVAYTSLAKHYDWIMENVEFNNE